MKRGAVMRIPVTQDRRCPRSMLSILRRLERLWPRAMHEYVEGGKRELVGLDRGQVQTIRVAPRMVAEGL